MKLSVFLNHVLEGASQQGLSVKEAMKQVREAGVTGIELDLADYMKDGESLIREIREAGMGISWVYGFHDWTRGNGFESGEKHVDTAIELGAKGILVIPGFVSEEEAVEMNALTGDREALYAWLDGNEKIAGLVAGLKHTLEYAAGRVFVTLEDFDGAAAPFATLNGLRYFMEKVPGLRFAMDCGNFAYSNEDAAAGFEVLHDLVVHVHTKDRGEEPEIAAKGMQWNRGLAPIAAGYGYMPVAKVVDTLQAEGYTGYYAIEHFGSRDHLRDIRLSAEWLLARA